MIILLENKKKMNVEKLTDEKYKGYTIKFLKPYRDVVIGVVKDKDVYFEINGLNKKIVLDQIKDKIDSLTRKPDISNPDGLSNYWVKGTNKVIRIRRDLDSVINPREWDNVTRFTFHHRRYNLPEELEINFNNFYDWEDMRNHIKKEFKPLMIRQVSMYDHSGLAFNLGGSTDRWDSGIVGFIIITLESWKEVMGDTPFTQKKGERIIKDELEEFDAWQKGEVYGFEIINGTTGEVEDSMWEFIDSGFKSLSEFEEMLINEAGYKIKEVEEI